MSSDRVHSWTRRDVLLLVAIDAADGSLDVTVEAYDAFNKDVLSGGEFVASVSALVAARLVTVTDQDLLLTPEAVELRRRCVGDVFTIVDCLLPQLPPPSTDENLDVDEGQLAHRYRRARADYHQRMTALIHDRGRR